MKLKYIYILTILAGSILYSCREDVEYPSVMGYKSTNIVGLTDLDNKFTVSINAPNEANSIDAIYFNKTTSIPLSVVTNEKDGTFKTGSVDIMRADVESLVKAGSKAVIHFLTNGDQKNIQKVEVEVKSALSLEAPKSVMFRSAPEKVKYKVDPTFAVSDAEVTVDVIVNPGKDGAAYTPYIPAVKFSGDVYNGEFSFKGSDFKLNDEIQFKVTAKANGYQSSVETPKYKLGTHFFSNTIVSSLVFDSTASVIDSVTTKNISEAVKIQDMPLTSTVEEFTTTYNAIKVLERTETTINIERTYKNKSGGDSVVIEKNPAQTVRFIIEKYTAINKAYDLVNSKQVGARSDNAQLIYNGTNIQVAAGIKLVAASPALFESKNVNDVKNLVDNPPAGSTVIDGPASINVVTSPNYAYSIEVDGNKRYGLIKLGMVKGSEQTLTIINGE